MNFNNIFVSIKWRLVRFRMSLTIWISYLIVFGCITKKYFKNCTRTQNNDSLNFLYSTLPNNCRQSIVSFYTKYRYVLQTHESTHGVPMLDKRRIDIILFFLLAWYRPAFCRHYKGPILSESVVYLYMYK